MDKQHNTILWKSDDDALNTFCDTTVEITVALLLCVFIDNDTRL